MQKGGEYVKKDKPRTREKVLTKREKPKLKALIVKLVEKLGSVSEASDLTDVPERTIYDRLEDWNKKKELTNLKGHGGGPKPKLSQQ